MELIVEIREKFHQNQFEFSRHAVDRMILRQIAVREILEAVSSGQVIEDYPQDRYSPSCLVLGFAGNHRALHIQVSYPSREQIKVITVYEPDPREWIDFRVRIS
jgi:hypothetical protein